jgi:hypothetical protein
MRAELRDRRFVDEQAARAEHSLDPAQSRISIGDVVASAEIHNQVKGVLHEWETAYVAVDERRCRRGYPGLDEQVHVDVEPSQRPRTEELGERFERDPAAAADLEDVAALR